MQNEHYNSLTQEIEKLKEQNESLKNFALVVTHDLNQPVRIIQKFLDIIYKQSHCSLPEREKEMFALMMQNCSHLKTLINEFQKFIHIESKRNTIKKVSLTHCINRSLKNLHYFILENQAEISVTPNFSDVYANSILIEQVITNIITNAIKFSKKDLPPKIHIFFEDNGEYLKIGIKDNGIGIESKYFEQIFELSRRLHPNSQYPGCGIGLTLCRKIIDFHKGEIWVESSLKKGTTVYFTLKNAIP